MGLPDCGAQSLASDLPHISVNYKGKAIWLSPDLKRQICDWMTACLHTGLLAFWPCIAQMSALTINWPIFNSIYL